MCCFGVFFVCLGFFFGPMSGPPEQKTWWKCSEFLISCQSGLKKPDQTVKQGWSPQQRRNSQSKATGQQLVVYLYNCFAICVYLFYFCILDKPQRPNDLHPCSAMVPPSGRASAAPRTVKKYKQNYFSSHHTQSRVSKRSFVFSLLMPLCWVDRHCVARPGQFQPLYIQCGG